MKRKSFFSILTVMLISAATVSFYGCNNDDNGGGGGGQKTDPSTIAAQNLIAYFAFEDNGSDAKGLSPAETGSGVSYVNGRRGKAFQGAQDAYFLYNLPENHKLRNLEEFSFSAWIKLVPTVDGGPEPMIFQIDGTTDWVWGNLFFLQNRNTVDAESGTPGPSPLCTYFWNDNGTSVDWQGNRLLNLNAPSYDRWIHFIATYNKNTSKFNAYFNGALYTVDGEPYEGTDRYRDGYRDTDQSLVGTTPAGALKFNNATKLSIGRWMGMLDGGLQPTDAWASDFTGQLDELRFYDRGLSATEANALYRAEVDNIN